MFNVNPVPQTPDEHVAPAVHAAGTRVVGKLYPYPATAHVPVDV